MNDLSQILDLTFAWVTTYLMHSTILLRGCWIGFRVLRPSSHTLAERAWKAAAIAGILTTSVQTNWDDANSLNCRIPYPSPQIAGSQSHAELMPKALENRLDPDPEWSVHVSTSPVPNFDAAPASNVAPPSRTPIRFQMPAELVRGLIPIPIANAVSSTAIKRTIATMAIGWFGIGVIRILWCVVVMRFRVQRFPVLRSGRSRRVLNGILRHNKIHRSVCLRAGPQKQEPVALGCAQWTILIPERFDQTLNEDEITAVLTHELAHLVRRDVGWLWIGKLMGACLGFQPMNLIARRRWQQSAEFLCDQWAIHHGTRQLDLAKCLTKLAAWKLDSGASRYSVAATGSKTTLARRVQCLVGGKDNRDVWQTTPRKWLSGFFVIAVTGLMIAIGPGVRVASPSTPGGVATRALHHASDGVHGDVDTLGKHAPVILQRLDDEISVRDFESLVRLNLQLTALNRELSAAIKIADGRSDSKAIAQQIEKICESVVTIETKRNGLMKHISTEQ